MTNDIVKGAVERLTQSLINVKEKWVEKGHWNSMSKVERKNALRVGIAYEVGCEIIGLKDVDVKATSATIKTEVDSCIDAIV